MWIDLWDELKKPTWYGKNGFLQIVSNFLKNVACQFLPRSMGYYHTCQDHFIVSFYSPILFFIFFLTSIIKILNRIRCCPYCNIIVGKSSNPKCYLRDRSHFPLFLSIL